MQARTSLLSARLSSRRPGPDAERREREAERTRLLEAGVAVLRDVVQAHPERDAYRFELVQALLESRARWEPEPGSGRGRPERGEPGERPPERPPGDRGERRGPREVGRDELAILREANEHAERLLRENTQVLEYRALAGGVGLELGTALRAVPAELAAEVPARQQEAETVLLTTLTNVVDQVTAPGLADLRFLILVLDLRRELVQLYLATNRRDEVQAQIGAVLELLEGQLAALPDGSSPPGLARWVEGLEVRQLAAFKVLLQRLPAPELLSRLETLRKNLRERLGR